MKLRNALGIVAVVAVAAPAAGVASVVSFHDANQGYHYYGGYNVLMYGQGAAVDPGNNIWNGFGKYSGPGSTDFFGGGNPDSAHGAVPSNSPGQPYAWHSGTSATGTALFSPLAPGAANTGNANSDGTLSPVTLSLTYDGDNGAGQGGSFARVTPGTPSAIFSEAALVSGSTLGTFTLGSVPAGTYNLFLYGANYDGDRGATFAVATGAAVGGFVTTTNPGNGGAGGPLQTYVLGADYVEFTGVTPDAGGNISGTWGSLANAITGQNGEGDFNGLQLQSAAAVPEPATLTLLAAGGLGLLARRRRQA